MRLTTECEMTVYEGVREVVSREESDRFGSIYLNIGYLQRSNI